jgi:hypothetical protein
VDFVIPLIGLHITDRAHVQKLTRSIHNHLLSYIIALDHPSDHLIARAILIQCYMLAISSLCVSKNMFSCLEIHISHGEGGPLHSLEIIISREILYMPILIRNIYI